MKVCGVCGDEIASRDGENICPACEAAERDWKKRQRRANQRRAREDALRSLGLVKVRGALGGTYWE